MPAAVHGRMLSLLYTGGKDPHFLSVCADWEDLIPIAGHERRRPRGEGASCASPRNRPGPVPVCGPLSFMSEDRFCMSLSAIRSAQGASEGNYLSVVEVDLSVTASEALTLGGELKRGWDSVSGTLSSAIATA